MTSLQNQTFTLENKTILITGAGSGLGKHFSLCLAKAGAFVILAGRREELLIQLANEIKSFGGKADHYCLDVTGFDGIQNHVNTLFNKFKKIDVLVNNAGLTSKIKKEPYEYTEEEWDNIFNTNVKATWFMSNTIAKKMIDHKIHGSIINISSTNAARPRPTNTLYCSSKSAVNAMTQNLGMEYAKYNIRVNTIAPGLFGVGMSQNAPNSKTWQEIIQKSMPMGRVGELKDLDGPLLLLASDASNYITGNCIYVDGGFSIAALV